jgi:hypothetical protein
LCQTIKIYPTKSKREREEIKSRIAKSHTKENDINSQYGLTIINTTAAEITIIVIMMLVVMIIIVNINIANMERSFSGVQSVLLRVRTFLCRSQWLRSLKHGLSARPDTGVIGSNPTRGLDVCVFFSVYPL